MASAQERFVAEALARGFVVEPRQFPEGTRTAVDAAAAIGCDLGQIVKSLVFVADGEPIVALVSGRNRVDVSALARVVGATSVRKADADQVRGATGFAIGGTPPFGYPQPLRVVADPDLLTYDELWAAAGTPDTVFPIAPEVLLRLTAPLVEPIAEQPG